MMTTNQQSVLDEHAVILVSGGAKGITAKCALKIAEHARCRFILAGRSAVMDAEPEWAAGKMDGVQLKDSALDFYQQAGDKVTPRALQKQIGQILSSREITTTLDQIRAAGGQALYISADVSDEQALGEQIRSAVEQFGAVTGVIHGAGVLADKRIENKRSVDFDQVVGTKIMGLQNILRAVNPKDLKFLVLFSSVAGFFGNAGQTDYALANDILNKSAYIIQNTLPDCRVICINWGPWDSGMVSPELRKFFKEKNISLIQTEHGTQALLDELSAKYPLSPQIVIGSPIGSQSEWTLYERPQMHVRRRLSLDNNPFLHDHRIGMQAVLPATCAASWLADTCQSLHQGYTFSGMTDFKILKGITFDLPDYEYDVELKAVPESGSSCKVYEALITSQNEKGRKIFHYSGKVTLEKHAPQPHSYPPVQTLDLDTTTYRDGSIWYEDGTLFHGPSFRGIQEVLQLDEQRVVVRVLLPPMEQRQQGQFPVRTTNPFINDAIVQSLLIWTQAIYAAPCLPSRLHQWDHYRGIPFGVPAWAVLEITNHTANAVVGNIRVQDEHGLEFFTFTGLEGTISRHLKRFIGKQDA